MEQRVDRFSCRMGLPDRLRIVGGLYGLCLADPERLAHAGIHTRLCQPDYCRVAWVGHCFRTADPSNAVLGDCNRVRRHHHLAQTAAPGTATARIGSAAAANLPVARARLSSGRCTCPRRRIACGERFAACFPDDVAVRLILRYGDKETTPRLIANRARPVAFPERVFEQKDFPTLQATFFAIGHLKLNFTVE